MSRNTSESDQDQSEMEEWKEMEKAVMQWGEESKLIFHGKQKYC